ncbi:hypothetical protein HK100_003637, partial [Physocladia obscura]
MEGTKERSGGGKKKNSTATAAAAAATRRAADETASAEDEKTAEPTHASAAAQKAKARAKKTLDPDVDSDFAPVDVEVKSGTKSKAKRRNRHKKKLTESDDASLQPPISQPPPPRPPPLQPHLKINPKMKPISDFFKPKSATTAAASQSVSTSTTSSLDIGQSVVLEIRPVPLDLSLSLNDSKKSNAEEPLLKSPVLTYVSKPSLPISLKVLQSDEATNEHSPPNKYVDVDIQKKSMKALPSSAMDSKRQNVVSVVEAPKSVHPFFYLKTKREILSKQQQTTKIPQAVETLATSEQPDFGKTKRKR